MQVLGAVREINELDLVVSLPNGLAGYVSLAEGACMRPCLFLISLSIRVSTRMQHDLQLKLKLSPSVMSVCSLLV